MGVYNNNGTPKLSILIGFSIINHPFWGTTIFGNTHMFCSFSLGGVQELIISKVLACQIPKKNDSL